MRKSLLLAWMLLSIPLFIFSQASKQITGTVTDDKGNPLPSVSILEKEQKTVPLPVCKAHLA